MKDDIHFTSRLLACSGFLMTGSGILMAWCGKLEYGGIFLAAASCIFFSAYHFRLQENKIKQTEEYENEK